MPKLTARLLAACVALLACLAPIAPAAEILIVDAKSQPESLTVAPGGILLSVARVLHSSTKWPPVRPLPRSSWMPARKAPVPFSLACSPMPLPTPCGPVN